MPKKKRKNPHLVIKIPDIMDVVYEDSIKEIMEIEDQHFLRYMKDEVTKITAQNAQRASLWDSIKEDLSRKAEETDGY